MLFSTSSWVNFPNQVPSPCLFTDLVYFQFSVVCRQKLSDFRQKKVLNSWELSGVQMPLNFNCHSPSARILSAVLSTLHLASLDQCFP